MSYTVGQLAALAHVTVRALHHYDEIGLLTPTGRTDAGYRRYSERDVERLQQVLFYRELGFPLDRIAALLDGETDPAAHLRTQRRLLTERIARLQAMISAIDQTMEANEMGLRLKPEERFEVFGDFVPEDHEAEARARWGSSPAFDESQRRAAQYSKDDWLQLKKEAGDIVEGLAAAMGAGVSADNVEAMDLAERHRPAALSVTKEVLVEHHHARHPEGDDLARGGEQRRRVERLEKILRLRRLIRIRPPERGQWPQRG